MSEDFKSDHQTNGSSALVEREDVGGAAELGGDSSSLIGKSSLSAHQKNDDKRRSRLENSVQDLQRFSDEFASLEPRILHMNKLVTAELEEIETKECELAGNLQVQINEYNEAKKQIRQLGEEHKKHTERNNNLSNDLEGVAEELNQMKKKMDEKASDVTDATPLMEIRAAIQRLKKENMQLDVRIGLLDHELIQARVSDRQHKYDDQANESDTE